MTYIIGRKFNVGVAKESSRGTTAAAVYWLPKTALSIDDKIAVVTDDSSINTIADAENQEIANTYAEGSIEGRASETTLGIFALATLGTETSQAAHSGETIVFDHVFNVSETVPHTSLSLSVSSANDGTGIIYPLTMVDTFELDLEVGKYTMYKVGFRGNKSVSATVATPSFAPVENAFRPQDGIVKFASAQSGLTAASAVVLRKCTLSIKKNIEDDFNIGATNATDRVNKQFSVEGTMELVYNDRSYIDTIMLGDLVKAVRISAVNSSVTIGSTTNPTIQIDLYKVKLSEVARKIDNNGIITQSLKFKAYYSLADAKMLTLTVVSLRAAAY